MHMRAGLSSGHPEACLLPGLRRSPALRRAPPSARAAGLPTWFAARSELASPRGGGQLGEGDLRAGRYGVIRSLLVRVARVDPLRRLRAGVPLLYP